LSPREYIFGFQDHQLQLQATKDASSAPAADTEIGEHIIDLRGTSILGPTRTLGPGPSTPRPTCTPGSKAGIHTIDLPRGPSASGPPRTPAPTRTPGAEASQLQHTIDLRGPEDSKSRPKRAGSGKSLKETERLLALFNIGLELKDDYLESTNNKKTWFSQILEGLLVGPTHGNPVADSLQQ
jgi:hypothetical protein